jgi:hypothetical protein
MALALLLALQPGGFWAYAGMPERQPGRTERPLPHRPPSSDALAFSPFPSEFTYDGDFVTSFTTPYGTTRTHHSA